METKRLGAIETRFAELIWANAPIMVSTMCDSTPGAPLRLLSLPPILRVSICNLNFLSGENSNEMTTI